MTTTFIICAVVLVLVLLYFVGVYNGLVRLRNNRENAFANIDVQLRQRHDMIPQLVSTVKGYAAHEKGLLEEVTRARTAAINATGINDKVQAENALSAALAGLKVSVEAYPELKANANFQQLQSDLTDTENRISYARQSFNDCVMMFNNAIQTFPGNVIANIAGFEPRGGFQAAEQARVTPNVQF